MDPIEQLKLLLTESLGEDETTKVVESLETFKKKVVEDAEASVAAKVEEGVKEAKITLEESYIAKLEEEKTKGDEAVRQEVTVFEQRLAKRVKTMLEQALEQHGDRLFTLEEQKQADQGKALVEQLEAMIATTKGDVNEGADGADPKSIKALKDRIAVLEGEVDKHKKDAIRARARANVAENEFKELKESIETGIQVTVDEDDQEALLGEGDAGTHADSQNGGKQTIKEGDSGKRKYSPQMENMRKIAGIA